jgi:hypothetical protein
MRSKPCLNCGKIYYRNYPKKRWEKSKFCSAKCKSSYRTKVGRVNKKCENCGKVFSVVLSEKDKIRCCSKKCSNNLRKITSRGKNNPSWKNRCDGNYVSLHDWIRRRLEKPKFCQECGIKPPIDLANISQLYKQNLSDWEWLCRRCHMVKDGRLEKTNGKHYEIKYD